MDDDIEFDSEIEVCDDDYKVTPCGSLGGLYGVSQGNDFLGEFAEHDAVVAFIKARMDREQFWPSVWFISDHGNVGPFNMN